MAANVLHYANTTLTFGVVFCIECFCFMSLNGNYDLLGDMVQNYIKRPGRGFFYLRLMAIIFTAFLTLIISILTVTAQETGFGRVVDEDVYIVKPGDRFRVDFWDGVTDAVGMVVTPEGSILLPPMGKIDVADMSLSETKEEIRKLVKRFYPDIEFTVSLDGIRSVKVLVTGTVKNPGFYNGYVADRVSEFIAKAGGFLPGASRRNITLSGGKEKTVVDLLLFERAGLLDANPFMYEGNVIYIPMVTDSSSFVQISGAVVRPGGIEYNKNDNIGTIISLALGFNDLENDRILIYRRNASSSGPINITTADLGFYLMPGDKIVVTQREFSPKPDYFTVTGEIAVSGRFPYNRGMNLESALSMAGGITEFGSIHSLTVYRRPEFASSARIMKSAPLDATNNIALNLGLVPMSVDLDRFIPDNLNEIAIAPGDSIMVPRLTGSVTVFGRILRPGVVDYEHHMTIRDLVARAGGYAPDAEKGKIELIKSSSGIRRVVRPGAKIYDGDIVIIPEKKDKKSFLEKVRDFSLILGGVGALYLAIDNAAD